MKRRDLIKNIAIMSGVAMLPVASSKLSTSTRHFVAIGNGACKALAYFEELNEKGTFTYLEGVVFNHDTIALEGMNPLIALQSLAKTSNNFVVLYGIGGVSNESSFLDFIILLEKQRKDFLVICTLPINFEGIKRRERADLLRKKLSAFSNIHFFDLNSLIMNYGNTSIQGAFKIADQSVYHLYRTAQTQA